MKLNLLPCYQIVCSRGIYSILLWDGEAFVLYDKTDEKPETVGNFIVYKDIGLSTAEQKLYRLMFIDEGRGICLTKMEIVFSAYRLYGGGTFICNYLEEKGNASGSAESWSAIRPLAEELSVELWGKPYGAEKFNCFIKYDSGFPVLTYLQPGGIFAGATVIVKVQDSAVDENGYISYRANGRWYHIENYPLPDGSSSWRFSAKD